MARGILPLLGVLPVIFALVPHGSEFHRFPRNSALSRPVQRSGCGILSVPEEGRLGRSGSRLTRFAKSPGGGKQGGGGGGGDGGGGSEKQKQSRKGAGVQTITIDKVDNEVQEKEDLNEEGWWRVLLHNDEIHTFEYVTEAIVKICPQLTRKKAYMITRTTHGAGVATVTTVWKSLAEQMCLGLQTFGLTVSIAPDAKFNDDNNIQTPEE